MEGERERDSEREMEGERERLREREMEGEREREVEGERDRDLMFNAKPASKVISNPSHQITRKVRFTVQDAPSKLHAFTFEEVGGGGVGRSYGVKRGGGGGGGGGEEKRLDEQGRYRIGLLYERQNSWYA